MGVESRRQAVHLSGIIFVFLAQFIGSIITIYFFIIALVLLLWSAHIQIEERRSKSLIKRLEHRFREFAMRFERRNVMAPFTGAIWYFFSCGLTFLIFPLPVASAACMILSVGDAASTLVGKNVGRKKVIGKKTFEGFLAFFLTSVVAAWLFIPFQLAIIGSLTGAVAELLFGMEVLEHLAGKGIVNDNLAVPILSAIAIFFSIPL
jgi:dolichol kinase